MCTPGGRKCNLVEFIIEVKADKKSVQEYAGNSFAYTEILKTRLIFIGVIERLVMHLGRV